MSTIFALSTIAGKSGVAVVRVSGDQAYAIAQKLTQRAELKPNHAYVGKLYNPKENQIIDHAITIYFAAPKSFTGEDVVEFHIHGSIAVIKELLEVLSEFKGVRGADRGEFAKRAFLNGKMDLTEAEGLAALIEAETSIQKSLALKQVSGELKSLYEKWRTDLIKILAQLEAFIDFPEDDIPVSAVNNARNSALRMANEIEHHMADNNRGEILSRGIRLAIVGEPNVGKSSLLNALSKREVAIVSEIAGTTRDVIENRFDLEGFPFVIFDTAGIRDTTDVIEQEGVKRALGKIEESDLILLVLDATRQLDLSMIQSLELDDKKVFILVNKVDLIEEKQKRILLEQISSSYENIYFISAKTNESLSILKDLLVNYAKENYALSSDPMITNARYRSHLNEALTYLKIFADDQDSMLEISTEMIRRAVAEIGMITGIVDVEEVLDVVFSSFCIGK